MVVRVARNEPCKFLRATYVLTYATSHLPLHHICLYTPTMIQNPRTALRVYPLSVRVVGESRRRR